MKKILMIASVAAMAVAMPAHAKPDKGQGGDHAAHGGGGGKHGAKGGGDAKPQRMDRQDFGSQKVKADKSHGNSFKHAEKAQKQHFKSAERSVKAEHKAVERQYKAQAKQAERVREARFEDDRFDNDRWDDNQARNGLARNAYGTCPPGLAKKNNGCLPPGHAKAMTAMAVGQQLQQNWYPNYNVPQDYRDFYADNSDYYYRYDDNGYIYRVNQQDDLISGLIPLLGGGFGIGQALPAGYDLYNVPNQYRDTYYDTDDANYRYGDNAIYQVDPQTQMIQSVVALLTGDNFGIGQALPSGYDMYNLPTQYRDQYSDTDQYNYRYADGNIYQVDPKTQIIQAIISALI